MHVHLIAKCERIRRNNGVVEVLFTRHPDMHDSLLQEDHILINVKWDKVAFEEGKHYLIDIQPAFPKEV